MNKNKKVSKLSMDDFLLTLRLCPRLCVDIIVIDTNNMGVLLVKRENEPFKGYWHLPGGFLLKNEPVNTCIKRLLRDEVGIRFNGKSVFVGLFENIDGDPRGHLLHYIVKIESEGITVESNKMRCFTRLPKMIPYQRKFISIVGKE